MVMQTSGKRIALVQTTRLGIARPDLGLGVGFLKAYIEDRKPNYYQIDIFESNDFISNISSCLAGYDLVAVSSVSNQYQVAKKIGKLVKNMSNGEILTVLGGAHISSLPSSLEEVFDYGVIGEGEQTFLELLEAIDQSMTDERILQIPGVVGRRGKEFFHGPSRKVLQELDSIPIPERSYFNKYKSIPSIIAARGCPFNCDFCTNRILWGRQVRRNSPERLVDELVSMTKCLHDIRVIVFRDDIVFLTEDYLTEVINVTRKRAPEVFDIPKVGYAHVNTLTESMILKLKEFGLVKIACGFESASPKILKILKQGSATPQDNQKAIDLCHKLGLQVSGSFIIGVPEESADDVRMTYEFVLKNVTEKKLGFGGVNILTPFPGTRYWDMLMKQEKDNLCEFNWERLDELGYLTFYEDTKAEGTVEQWWKEREKNQNIYLGGTPTNQFIRILHEYEPELMRLQADFLKRDRKY